VGADAGIEVRIRPDSPAGHRLAAIEGKIVRRSRGELERVALQLLDGEGVADLWLDLSRCSYIDSGGLQFLISLHRRAKARRRSVHLFGYNEDLLTLFELTKLHTLLHLTKTIPDDVLAMMPRPEPR
jgi:anti-anti-sigma factor